MKYVKHFYSFIFWVTTILTAFIVPTSKYEFPTIRDTYLNLGMRIRAKGFTVQSIIYSCAENANKEVHGQNLKLILSFFLLQVL